jgi:hypothetical protein
MRFMMCVLSVFCLAEQIAAYRPHEAEKISDAFHFRNSDTAAKWDTE